MGAWQRRYVTRLVGICAYGQRVAKCSCAVDDSRDVLERDVFWGSSGRDMNVSVL